MVHDLSVDFGLIVLPNLFVLGVAREILEAKCPTECWTVSNPALRMRHSDRERQLSLGLAIKASRYIQ